MNKLYVLVGIPGSGKSYFAESHKECKVVCLDTLRKELLGDENDQRAGNYIAGVGKDLITKYLNEGFDVIYDACNVKRRHRKSLLKNFNAYKIGVFIDTPLEKCIEQNNSRSRHVPEDVIIRMSNNLQIPTLEEGFDEISIKSYNAVL